MANKACLAPNIWEGRNRQGARVEEEKGGSFAYWPGLARACLLLLLSLAGWPAAPGVMGRW